MSAGDPLIIMAGCQAFEQSSGWSLPMLPPIPIRLRRSGAALSDTHGALAANSAVKATSGVDFVAIHLRMRRGIHMRSSSIERGISLMRGKQLIYAAIIAAMMPTVAFADDPHDAAMRNAAARARDREMTRQLNLEEMARVQKRDARFTQRSRPAHTGGNDAVDEYAARSRDHERATAIYTRNRAQYERDMAKWDRAVAACRAGDYRACDN